MREFAAWALLISIVGMWVAMPWRQEPILRLFNAESDEELLRRFTESRRLMVSVGLVIVVDLAGAALALMVLL